MSIIAKVGGRVNNKGVRSISADGKTMTIKVVAIAPNGQETPITLVFKRVWPEHALMIAITRWHWALAIGFWIFLAAV